MRVTPALCAAVFIGGCLGTGLRASVGTVFGVELTPVATLIVNLLGAFALGVLVPVTAVAGNSIIRAGVGTGVLGGFTSYSALALDSVTLLHDAQFMAFALYVGGTVIGGAVLAATGLALGGAITRRREHP